MYCFSDLPPVAVETIQMSTKAPTGAIEFRDDVDLIEQVFRFILSNNNKMNHVLKLHVSVKIS